VIRLKAGSNPLALRPGIREARRPAFIALQNLFAPGKRGKRAQKLVAAACDMPLDRLRSIETGVLNASSAEIDGIKKAVKERRRDAGPVMRQVAGSIDLSVLGRIVRGRATPKAERKPKAENNKAAAGLVKQSRAISEREVGAALRAAGVFKAGRVLLVELQSGLVVLMKPEASLHVMTTGNSKALFEVTFA